MAPRSPFPPLFLPLLATQLLLPGSLPAQLPHNPDFATYRPLIGKSPFSAPPKAPSIPNPTPPLTTSRTQYTLRGVIPQPQGWTVHLIDPTNPQRTLTLTQDRPLKHKADTLTLLDVTQAPEDFRRTTVTISQNGQPITVTYPQKATAQPQPNRPATPSNPHHRNQRRVIPRGPSNPHPQPQGAPVVSDPTAPTPPEDPSLPEQP